MKKTFIYSTMIISTLLLQACGGNNEAEEEETLKPLVKIEKAEKKKFIHEIRVQGNIETDQDITLSAEMGGLITSINVKEGSKVSKGQTIAEVDASVLSSNLNELKTQLEYAEYMLEKQQELIDRGVGSEVELEAAKNRVNSLKASMQSISVQRGKATIRAPFSGVIDQVFAKQGQMAGPSSPIVRIVNNKTVDITASISEKHFSKIKKGTPITVSFPNYGDTSIVLNVEHVGNYIEPTNRTFRIKSTIKNNDYFLPNMLAEVSITDLEIESGLVIPSRAILKDQDNHDFIYIATKSKKEKELYQVNKIQVKVVERYKGEALIESDKVKDGSMVVVEGARGVSNNELVRIK
jgi:RND family efflux transporter MFP subunit